ncbi:hypothetical protein A1Q2_07956 [Trichosporon asahii var. asahii CBS 8904]|uniref:Uncharacterized protein n=1 Tax=Trichosporon asahii var. asahii (strain CBS 8904) TaxID=1220162 RepID=K1VM11_TRIAC|nr:hypothetical protein A1Q2_07956 [Trichosporon asahii var. asahii CBS 8904]
MPTLLESPFLSLGMIDTLLRTTSDPAQRVQLLSARVHRLQLEPAINPSSSHSSLSSHSASHGHGHHAGHPHQHGSHPYAHAAQAHGHLHQLSGLAALAAHQPRSTKGPGNAYLDEYGHATVPPHGLEHGHERPAQVYGDGFGFELDLSRSTSRATSRANSRANSRAPSPVRSSGGNTRAGSPTLKSPVPKRPSRPDPTPLLTTRAQLVKAYLSLTPPDYHAAESEALIVLAECRRIVKWEKARIRRSEQDHAKPSSSSSSPKQAPKAVSAEGAQEDKEERKEESKEDKPIRKNSSDADLASSPVAPPVHVSPAWYPEVLKIQLETTRHEATINEGLGRESRAARAAQLADELAAELSNL